MPEQIGNTEAPRQYYIPDQFWNKIKAYLDGGKTGGIQLNVFKGKIQEIRLTQSLRLTDSK